MTDIAHPALEAVLDIGRYSEIRYGFVSLGHTGRTWTRFIRKAPRLGSLVRQAWLAYRMAWRIWRAAWRSEQVVVLEIFPRYMLPWFPLLLPLRGKLLFMLHHVQTFAMRGGTHDWAFRWFRWLGFAAVVLECDDSVLEPRYRWRADRLLVIPHPVITGLSGARPRRKARPEGRVRVGLVGMLRPGKPQLELLDRLRPVVEGLPECDLVVGAPSWLGDKARLEESGVEVVDTDAREAYLELLGSLDISVQAFGAADYFFRASGTVAEAISCGCHVMCPDLPVLRHQVSWPCRVGTVYESFDALPRALGEAVNFVRAGHEDNLAEYASARDARALAALFDSFVRARRGARAGRPLAAGDTGGDDRL